MLLIFLIVSFYATSLAIDRPYYDLENADQYFEEFIINYNKNYPDTEEKQKRFEIFKENLKIINHLNSFNASIHGVTEMVDLSVAEFREQRSCLSHPGQNLGANFCNIISDSQISTNNAPAVLDYRAKNAVSPVKSQGQCGSCWAFASVGALEGAYALKYRQLTSFSPQQLNDCLRCSGHCAKGGQMYEAFSELKNTAGVMLDSDYPYAGKDLPCQFQQSKAKVRVTGCYNFDLKDENKLKEALSTHGPITIAVYSDPLQTYHGGIVTASTCSPYGQVNHGVLLVGYGTENGQDYWIVKNSWAETWGSEGGYFRMARGQNVCAMMNEYAASPIIA